MENFTLTANTSHCYPADSTSRRRSFIFFYLVIILASIPLNSFFLYVSWQHIRQRNELGVYLFNLALSDLTFTLGLSLWMDFLWRGVWAHGGLACILSIYCLFTNFYTSDALLCCIAFDRYLAVVHPFKYGLLRKVSTATGVCFAIWVLVLVFNAVTISLEDSGASNDSQVSLCFDIFLPLTENMVRANFLRFFLGFVVPLLVVMFSTLGICRAVRSNQATEEWESKRVRKLLVTVFLCLLFCFGPIHVIMLVRTLTTDCKAILSLLYPHKLAIAVSCLNCLADPLLYCFITRTGKAKLNQVILYFQGKNGSKDEQENASTAIQTNPV